MRIGLSHSTHIADKIAVDLSRSPYIKFTKGIDSTSEKCRELVYLNLKREHDLENRVDEIIEENEDEIEYHLADEKELFKMIKKKLAIEEGLLLNYEERFSDLSHTIARELLSNNLIELPVKETLVKNIVFDSIEEYLNQRLNIEDSVIEKIRNYKKKIFPGTDEYHIIFQKLYEDELRAKGMK